MGGAQGWWAREPLWRRVRDRAAAEPDKPAVIDETGALSYGALWRAALAGAAGMRAEGLRPGEIVLTQLPNWREFAAVMLACEVGGAVFSFCPVTWGVRECARALDLLRPRLWVTSASYLGEDRMDTVRGALAEAAEAPEPVLVRGGAAGFRAWSGDPRGGPRGERRGDRRKRRERALSAGDRRHLGDHGLPQGRRPRP